MSNKVLITFHQEIVFPAMFISPSFLQLKLGEYPPSCSAVLPVVQLPDEQLLTVGVAFPAISHFFEDPEGVFLEDIKWEAALINRK